ncbi:unnamed protein product [Moneuplotes crassus]|uniref:Uncharacterized protein n=1 Tax=Euplotes crassus TaxID=5936 RepID=A0AAD2D957_EUPCR|nr:unnamed protein product [Moneuplotes crassus]
MFKNIDFFCNRFNNFSEWVSKFILGKLSNWHSIYTKTNWARLSEWLIFEEYVNKFSKLVKFPIVK